MITVESNDKDVRVTISKDSLPPERLNAFLDWLRFEEIAQRSKLTEEEAGRMADEIKSRWWDENRARFIPPHEL